MAKLNKRTKVFISYSHQDTKWLQRLSVHLKPLERARQIDIWNDTRIRPGSRWREEIRQAITDTKVAVLLVSADFLASEFIATDELPPLLSAAEKEGAVILPVILSPSRFLQIPSLARFQTVNEPSKPLISMTKNEQETVFVEVSEAIEFSLKLSPATTNIGRRRVLIRRSLLIAAVCALLIATFVTIYWLSYESNEGVLVVQVANPLGQPLTDVVLSTTGDSSTSAATDEAGKTRLRLAPQTKPGDEITLQVVHAPRDVVFISPWNQRVRVHSFEKESQNVAEVVLADRGDRMLLEYPQAAVAMVLKINAANAERMGMEPLTEERRRANLVEAAKAFGFSPEEVDRAIRALSQKTTDPYQLGMVALYAKNYPEATRQLSVSVMERKQRLEEAKGELVKARELFGQTLYEQGLYRQSVSEYREASELRPTDDNLLNKLGVALLGAGEYIEAEQSLQRRLEIIEQAPQSDQFKLAQSLNNLGMVYQAQGRFHEAEPLFKRALSLWEKYFGSDHPDVAIGLNNLGNLYIFLAKYRDAEELHKRALEIREKHLGSEHPDLARSLNNLAFLYQTLARNDEAEILFKKSLEIWQKQPVAEHPDSASSLNNLAMVYEAQGEYVEAETHFKRALEIWTKLLGGDHPNVAKSHNNLAMVYQAQGKVDVAEHQFKEALEISERRLGPEHPEVARILSNLGMLYFYLNRNNEAEPLLVKALPIWEKRVGPEHPDVARTINNLAMVYQAQGRYDEAKPLHNRALAIWEARFGLEHPETATGLNNLGRFFLAQDKYDEAQPFFEKACPIYEKYFKPDHNSVIKCISSLAVIYEAQGRYAEAEPLFKRALPIWETRLSHEYKSVIKIMERYASLLRNTNRVTEAQRLESRARKIHFKMALKNGLL
ncbi:MAG TPA: tetratricopeptide repeat protein [Pedobacter sp.]|jgi:tetratricopeptide (TPR) repeat protein